MGVSENGRTGDVTTHLSTSRRSKSFLRSAATSPSLPSGAGMATLPMPVTLLVMGPLDSTLTSRSEASSVTDLPFLGPVGGETRCWEWLSVEAGRLKCGMLLHMPLAQSLTAFCGLSKCIFENIRFGLPSRVEVDGAAEFPVPLRDPRSPAWISPTAAVVAAREHGTCQGLVEKCRDGTPPLGVLVLENSDPYPGNIEAIAVQPRCRKRGLG